MQETKIVCISFSGGLHQSSKVSVDKVSTRSEDDVLA